MDGSNLIRHAIRGLGGIVSLLEYYQRGGIPLNDQALMDVNVVLCRLENVARKAGGHDPKPLPHGQSWESASTKGS